MPVANRRRKPRVLSPGLFAEVLSSTVRVKWPVGNLSAEGMYVRARSPFPPGTTMMVALPFPGTPHGLVLEAVVVYTVQGDASAAGMGLHFENLSEDARGRIDSLLRSLTERAKGTGTGPGPAGGASTGARRKHRRWSVHKLQADVLDVVSGVLARAVKVRDVSLGGLYLETERALAVGSDVSVDLSRPGKSDRIRLEGRVIGVTTGRQARMAGKAAGMSIQFTAMTATLSDQLEHFLSGLAPVPAP